MLANVGFLHSHLSIEISFRWKFSCWSSVIKMVDEVSLCIKLSFLKFPTFFFGSVHQPYKSTSSWHLIMVQPLHLLQNSWLIWICKHQFLTLTGPRLHLFHMMWFSDIQDQLTVTLSEKQLMVVKVSECQTAKLKLVLCLLHQGSLNFQYQMNLIFYHWKKMMLVPFVLKVQPYQSLRMLTFYSFYHF